ncbi:MAG: hypothetical protein Ct9H90mP9_5970 [Pseudomonadota bacterium]|nr:MAG: hypothetical protein Ct9H90mP9_5970 [Pseudomonadota bacterium]
MEFHLGIEPKKRKQGGQMARNGGDFGTPKKTETVSASFQRRNAPKGDDRQGPMCEPKLIIADEPTTALDVTIQAQILELMKDLSSRLGGLIVITHNLVSWPVCRPGECMYAGKIIESGTPHDIYQNRRIPIRLDYCIPFPDWTSRGRNA